MKRVALPLALIAVSALAGCSRADVGPAVSPSPTPETFRAIGAVQVPMDMSATLPLQDGEPTVGKPCIPRPGYDDISEGTQVVVSNASGEKIALGSLEAGTLANGPTGDAFYQSVCLFSFAVDNIPSESRIYSVHFGNNNRGEQSFTETDLTAGVALTLG